MSSAREQALVWLVRVIDHGVSVNQLLAESASGLEPKQQAFAKQLLFGCCRYYFRLKTIAEHLLTKPLKSKDSDVMVILLLGLYQLTYLSIPDHAAISESVELTKMRNKSWAAGLVNGILRHFQRDSKQVANELNKSLQYQYAHPGWMVKRIRQDWPRDADDVMEQNNLQAPMILRVNTGKISREDYLQSLLRTDINASAHSLAVDGIILEKACDVFQLPGFEQGWVSVQDGAAQLAVELLNLQAGHRVLDACAAPGGKTTHILQRQPDVRLTAVELSASRARRIQESLERLELNCEVICADITDTEVWWDDKPFDRILLDVPCSASGVIRRNPDIKIHRKVTDVAPLVKLQSRILEQSWKQLKVGGILVYATCSVFDDENQNQINAFMLDKQVELVSMPEAIDSKLERRARVGYQILPGEMQMDGFYLCGLRKLG